MSFLFSIAAQSADAVTRWKGFPSGFRWGVATSAHQIEGQAPDSDWLEWERRPGRTADGHTAEHACDHWNRVSEDVALVHDLGVSDYRFSVEWARIEPKEGQWDDAALDRYAFEVEQLRATGIRPIVTLQHFTLPLWLSRTGGWERTDAPLLFERYVRHVAQRLGDQVQDWITLNEPMIMLLGGYLVAETPPGKRDKTLLGPVLEQLLRAHGRAYHAIHKLTPSARVGIAHHLRVFDPKSRINPLDRTLTGVIDQFFNWSFADAIRTGVLDINIPLVVAYKGAVPEAKGTEDFFGINYYTRDIIQWNFAAPPLFFDRLVHPRAELSDLKWEIYPDGLLRLAREAHRRYPELKILITENGIADQGDSRRVAFLKSHLLKIKEAIDEGIPIEGYIHWSLMDNFEWLEGFVPRFGLYEVDYATQVRRPRASAHWFAELAQKNGFVLER